MNADDAKERPKTDAPYYSANPAAPANPPLGGSEPVPAASSRRIPVWGIVVCLCVVAMGIAELWAVASKAKPYAQAIACRNNLKSVGLAFRTWSPDQSDSFVFNVSTNVGGTLEWCLRGPDGLDKNSWIHFRALSNELMNPKILCCPSAPAKPALNFEDLQPANVTYQIHSGTNIAETNPNAVLIVCPIHHHVVLCDGSVQEGSETHMRELLSVPQNAN